MKLFGKKSSSAATSTSSLSIKRPPVNPYDTDSMSLIAEEERPVVRNLTDRFVEIRRATRSEEQNHFDRVVTRYQLV
jgi:hypothetical protein